MENFDKSAIESEQALLLPDREALGVFDLASVTGLNQSLALNAGTFGPSTATAMAGQAITVTQS
jgi:hypothetical protein